MLTRKLLRKREETRKQVLTELFSDRALAAVKAVQTKENPLIDTWVRSTRALDIKTDPSDFSPLQAEFCSLKVGLGNCHNATLTMLLLC